MGLFDKMFGRGAAVAEREPQAQQTFESLKSKYRSVLSAIEQQQVRLQNLHVENGKLVIRGVAPSNEAKNAIWNQIKLVDPSYPDLAAEITVSESRRASPPAAARTYTVQRGDSLSKISKQFYGDANEYMRIFYANRDKISDPDLIHPGQVLVIPPDDDR